MNRLSILGVAATMIATVSCTCSTTQPAGTSEAAPDTLTVMSFNIRNSNANDGDNHWNNRRATAARVINEVRPTFLGIQEGCQDQIVYLDSALVGYCHKGLGRDDGRLGGEMMAIYYDTTRVSLGNAGTFWLSETPDTVSRGWDAACNRTVEWGEFTLKDSGRKIVYFNTHLDHIGPVARENSINLIVDRAKELVAEDLPWLITADFNTNADDSIFNPLKKYASEARKTAPTTSAVATFNGFGNPGYATDAEAIIDHIFYRNVEPLEFSTLTSDYGIPYISDHFPITLKFIVK